MRNLFIIAAMGWSAVNLSAQTPPPVSAPVSMLNSILGKQLSENRGNFERMTDNPKTLKSKGKMVKTDEPKKSAKNKKTAYEPLVIVTPKVSMRSATLLNGDKDDFSPTFFNNGILFCTSSKKTKKKDDDKPTPEDLNLKFAAFDSMGALTRPTSFAGKINSKANEGPSCFSKDALTMFLTRTYVKRGQEKKNADGNLTVKVYIKTRLNDSADWSGDEVMPFETENYNYAHPTLSADGNKLYFSSNMPGGFGGMDLYYSRRLPDGTWSQPVNLGPRVNTSKNEVFPWISEAGMLYFSSNGLFGAQGLDLFRIEIENRTARSLNLGAPFNSPEDDFGIMFLPNNLKKGYFSTNRKGTQGGDDIMEFEMK
ncbi:MAG: hypothetical protein RL757_2174 [Bacteroidota bacterium]|jgi:hypothetical protein